MKDQLSEKMKIYEEAVKSTREGVTNWDAIRTKVAGLAGELVNYEKNPVLKQHVLRELSFGQSPFNSLHFHSLLYGN